MYWRAPRLAFVATWVIQSLQNKYVYIIIGNLILMYYYFVFIILKQL